MLRLTLTTVLAMAGVWAFFGDDLSSEEQARVDALRAERITVATLWTEAFQAEKAKAPAPVRLASVDPDTLVNQPAPTQEASTTTRLASYATDADTLAELRPDLVPTVVVSDPDKLAAFLAPEVTDRVAETVSPTVSPVAPSLDLRVVTGNRVNVRSGPSTSNGVLDQVVKADIVAVMSDEINGWVKISIQGEGVEGYMSARFLEAYVE